MTTNKQTKNIELIEAKYIILIWYQNKIVTNKIINA